ncbi:MAG: hypothetical protein ABFS08_11390 [Pseudomonadota bacterium]
MNNPKHTMISSLLRGTLLVGALVMGITNVQAASVFSPIFEMDGNPQEQAASGDDWENLYGGGGSALAHIVTIPDQIGLPGFVGPDNIFHHGCSDVKDIFGCYVKVGDKTLPDKDDWTNGSIALYTYTGPNVDVTGAPGLQHETGDLIIVMQGDIHAPNGDASIGAWFFQDDIITAPAPGEHFPIHRTPGDLFIEADYTGGGTNVAFSVYTWTGLKNNTVQELFSGPALKCNDTDSPLGCAIANDQTIGTIPTVWPYTAKGDDPGTTTHYPETTFFEGVFNFSAAMRALGTEMGCFSSFLYETRSSHSITARLHDYILGGLPMCQMEVDKSGPVQSKVGDDAGYTITVSNTGVVALTKSSINDDVLGNLTGDAGCGATLDPGQSCTINVNYTIPEGADDPLPNTVTAIYNFGSDTVQAEASHAVDLFVPSFTLTKTGDALSKIGDAVNYTITLSNTSTADSPALECTITDAPLGVNKTISLTSGQSDETTVTGYTIPEGADDPYTNTASATCSPAGFPNILEASASHDVDLFQPSITLTKSGDSLSKIGDTVDYVITLENTSSDTTPELACTLSDDMLGLSETFSIATGASHVINVNGHAVPESAADPYRNTATVSCSPDGFPNVLTAEAIHEVNLFQPAITLTKSGDTLSKIGDAVDYTITLNNTSSGDSPNLVCTISDTKLGFSKPVTLASGANDVSNITGHTVPATAGDPYINTASVSCSPEGFPNVLTASDNHSVNLFQPEISLAKSGTPLSKIGDDVSYTITLNNDSSADTPAMECTVTDAQLSVSKTVTLASGANDITPVPGHTVPEDATDPYNNTAGVSCSPVGFPNVLTDNASHSVNLFQPSITLAKSGDELSKIGDGVDYNITLNNTSSADTPDMVCSITDSTIGFSKTTTLASGASDINTVTGHIIPAEATDPYNNTAGVACSPVGFPNVLTTNASHSVNLFQPSITLAKTGDELSKIGDGVDYNITLNNTSSADTPNLVCSITDSRIGFSKTTTLASGASDINAIPGYTIPAEAADPYLNTASVECSPVGFPNTYVANDSHSVNLFQPELTLAKVCKDPSDGDNVVVVGNDAVFEFVLNNTSSGDSPALNRVSVSDSLLGDIASSFPASLASGDNPTVSVNYPTSAPGMLNNSIEVVYQVAGFPNQLTRTASAACEVIPGNEGCTPGYWKTHPEQWDGVAPDATSTIKHQMLFNETFGVTSARSGLADTVTLMDAVNLGAGGLMALNRHAAAALPSADSVEYSYSLAGVINLYRDAVGAISGPESIYSALAKLSAANEKDCPLN